ncbi:MAG: hypothetical protein LBD12_06085, partial [Clostridiales Family XIII bacterium]|nr:hypothetical protein [Clostridiales Family XIII bacterium]
MMAGQGMWGEQGSILLFGEGRCIALPLQERSFVGEDLRPAYDEQDAVIVAAPAPDPGDPDGGYACTINGETLLPGGRLHLPGDVEALLLYGTERHCSTRGLPYVRIGDSASCHIRIAGDAEILLRQGMLWIIRGDCFLNGIALGQGRATSFVPGDTLFVGDVRITAGQDCLSCLGTAYETSLRDRTEPQDTIDFTEFPEYKRSPRIVKSIPDETVHIALPKDPEKPSRGQLVKAIVPPLVMLVLTVSVSLLMGRGLFMIVMAAGMGVTVIFSVTGYFNDKKERKKNEQNRVAEYKAYLLSLRKRLYALRGEEAEAGRYANPGLSDIETMVEQYSSRIYERASEDDDFLCLSLGTATILPACAIRKNEDEVAIKTDELNLEMRKVVSLFDQLPNMPQVVDLKNAHLGIVGEKTLIHEQLKAYISQICFLHSYHDVEIVLLIDEADADAFRWARWYPHCRIKSINVSGIVTGENQRDQVLGNLAQLLKERRMKRDERKTEHVFLPHYVFIIDNPKLVANHSIMEYLQNASTDLGFSLVFTTNMQANLPENIRTIIALDGPGRGSLVLNEGRLMQTAVETHVADGIRFERMARRLNALHHNQGVATHIPESITFFGLLGVKKPADLPILQLWQNSNSAKSLAVPLGVRGEDDIVYLNLHEKAHGPHGLVAGTTGSGKSEILQSYIMSLAVHFHPYEVGFLLIDY